MKDTKLDFKSRPGVVLTSALQKFADFPLKNQVTRNESNNSENLRDDKNLDNCTRPLPSAPCQLLKFSTKDHTDAKNVSSGH